MANESRKWTRLLLEAIDGGILNPRDVVLMCVNHMSEFDVKDMCLSNDLEALDPNYKDD